MCSAQTTLFTGDSMCIVFSDLLQECIANDITIVTSYIKCNWSTVRGFIENSCEALFNLLKHSVFNWNMHMMLLLTPIVYLCRC